MAMRTLGRDPVGGLIDGFRHLGHAADLGQLLGEMFAEVGILVGVVDVAAALFEIDVGVDQLAARVGGLRASWGPARPQYVDQPEAVLSDTEVLMEPVPATGGGGYQAALLVALLADHVAFAVFPGMGADALRPAVGIALALEAHQDGFRGMAVAGRIAASRVLGDEAVGLVLEAAKAGLDTAIAGGALVVQRHIAVDDVGVDVAVQQRSPVDRIGDQLGPRLEEILVVLVEAGRVFGGVLEDELAVGIQIHDRRGIGGCQQ